jgi:IclR family acetate operon transcriptional repressor
MLADLPFAEVRRLIEAAGWRSYTPKSVTTFPELEQALSEVKANGYAIDRGGRSLGTNCLAAPIRDATGRVVAAISVTGPRERATEERLQELVSIVRERADLVSYRLGFDESMRYHSLPVS